MFFLEAIKVKNKTQNVSHTNNLYSLYKYYEVNIIKENMDKQYLYDFNNSNRQCCKGKIRKVKHLQ